MQASNVVEGSRVETVTPMVFESFFDRATGEWSLRRVPARPRIRRVVVQRTK